MYSPIIKELAEQINSLKEQIETQKETINSGIFTTDKEKVAAKLLLIELEEKSNELAWKLAKEIMP